MQKITTAEHTASIIKKCFSPAALRVAAGEMGEEILAGEDIFQALIRAGRALDIETAVMLVVAHLDGQDASPSNERGLLNQERRHPEKDR